jgi:hypothetical protein
MEKLGNLLKDGGTHETVCFRSSVEKRLSEVCTIVLPSNLNKKKSSMLETPIIVVRMVVLQTERSEKRFMLFLTSYSV